MPRRWFKAGQCAASVLTGEKYDEALARSRARGACRVRRRAADHRATSDAAAAHRALPSTQGLQAMNKTGIPRLSRSAQHAGCHPAAEPCRPQDCRGCQMTADLIRTPSSVVSLLCWPCGGAGRCSCPGGSSGPPSPCLADLGPRFPCCVRQAWQQVGSCLPVAGRARLHHCDLGLATPFSCLPSMPACGDSWRCPGRAAVGGVGSDASWRRFGKQQCADRLSLSRERWRSHGSHVFNAPLGGCRVFVWR